MVAGGLSEVAARAALAAQRAGRDPKDVTLVAVSKTVGPDEIRTAYEMGHRDFGENRANELAAKAPELPPDINWHFVGSLQSRKARQVAPFTSTLHSIDRPSLLKAWAATGSKARLLLQVNLAEEPQKHGARSEDAAALLAGAAELGLEISGLMLIPPLAATAEESRPWFVMLRKLQEELVADWPHLTELSMGMTDDFEVAIEEGATLIRVGRAIFGY